MNQRGFEQKRKKYLIDNAREVFERLQAAGQLKTEKSFAVTVDYPLVPAPEQG